MKKLLTLVMLITILACSQDDDSMATFLDCNDHSDKYKVYTGEDIGCQFYFTLTEYDNQRYIELGSHCADLVRPFVFNENCEDICATTPYDETSLCGKYLSGRNIVEVLLIER